MMHFPPCSRFPPYFLTFWKISKILPYPEKMFRFHPPKFLTTLFYSSTTNFGFPLFFLIRENLLFSLTFQNFPLCFPKIQQLFTYFTCISPYFYHDAFMHHPMHVLDAPDFENEIIGCFLRLCRSFPCQKHSIFLFKICFETFPFS